MGKGYNSEEIRDILLKNFPEEAVDGILKQVIESNQKVAEYIERALETNHDAAKASKQPKKRKR